MYIYILFLNIFYDYFLFYSVLYFYYNCVLFLI